LRDWIVAQTAEGHSPEVVLEAMKASGWEEAVARIALAGTLGEKAAGVASSPRGRCPAAPSTRPGRACAPATATWRC
jgi:prolyl 4-hydroxylase